MDIEATVVDRIHLRNKRFLKLSKWLRWKVGDDYPLGAITPDPVTGLYWARFPYKRTRRLYDVFVPMGYFSFRASGYRDVKNYTAAGIRTIRRETADPKVPIHWIGGIAGETKGYEVKGFVRALKGHKAIGGSYYDFSITTREEWGELRVIAGRRPPARRNAREKSERADKSKDRPNKKKATKKKATKKDDAKRDSRGHDKRRSRAKRRDGKSGKHSKKRGLEKKGRRSEDRTKTVEDDPYARRLL